VTVTVPAMVDDYRDIIAGIAEFGRHANPEPPGPYDDLSTLGRERRRLAMAFASEGWLGMGSAVSPDGQPLAALTAAAEAATNMAFPLNVPLAESWTALRLAELAGSQQSGTHVTALASAGLFRQAALQSSPWVPWATTADQVLVPELAESGAAEVIELPAHDIDWAPAPRLDATLATGRLPAMPAGAGRSIGSICARCVRRLRVEYLCLQTAEMVGAARELTSRTVEYLKTRQQFGRPLATFQALQHKAADMLVTAETAKSLLDLAVAAAGEHRPCEHRPAADVDPARSAADRQAYEIALSVKGYVGETCSALANDAIQLHGGVGYTWEGGVHWNAGRILHQASCGISAREALIVSGLQAIRRGSPLGATIDLTGGTKELDDDQPG